MVQNAIFRGKRHDNKILKVKILLSRNFVVMAQAPRFAQVSKKICLGGVRQKNGQVTQVSGTVCLEKVAEGLLGSLVGSTLTTHISLNNGGRGSPASKF